MTIHKSARRTRKLFTILIIFLLVVMIFTIYKAVFYFHPPSVEKSYHYLYLTVDTSKNLTIAEAVGYTNSTVTKYIMIQMGGITFYTLSPGLSLTREVEVSNRQLYTVKIEASTVGNISQFLKIEMPQTEIPPKQKVTINITAKVPENYTIEGKYRGNLTITLTPKE